MDSFKQWMETFQSCFRKFVHIMREAGEKGTLCRVFRVERNASIIDMIHSKLKFIKIN